MQEELHEELLEERKDKMALKSYSSFKKTKKEKKARPIKDMIVGGTTAIIGVGLLGLTAEAVGRV